MRRTPRSLSLSLAAAVVGAVFAVPGAMSAVAADGPASSAAVSVTGSGCAASGTPPRRAAAVESTDPALFSTAARRTAHGSDGLSGLAEDHTLYLDGCGRPLYAEPSLSARQIARSERSVGPALGKGKAKGKAKGKGSRGHGPRTSAIVASASSGWSGRAAATALPALSDTFTLNSRPGASRTIYLDFKGGSVASTAWNASYSGGAAIAVPPYSTDADTSTFSSADLTEIQRVWQIVSEDYAPFDVNVTTADPGAAALQRSSSSDTVYGARVVVAGGTNPIYTSCRCGGIAYVGVFNLSGTDHDYYQPAWVFTGGVGTGGKNIAEAASHEAGHLFGLYHDGTLSSGYYSGAAPWAPIMGAGYYQPLTQWSIGEYPGANQTQDDLAVIATGAPMRTDDVGDTAASAGMLWPQDASNGVISTRSDIDAWRFTAAGTTTVTVTPAAYANLDASLRITDSTGTTLATVNPTASATNAAVATGLGASYSFTAPSDGATYLAYVDGVGQGALTSAGSYSDYASLGNYQIALTTGSTGVTPSTPVTLATTPLPGATVGQAYSANPVTAQGGASPYSYTATGLPAGLSIAATTGQITGTPTTAGMSSVVIRVTDAAGQTATTAALSLVVAAAPSSALTISTTSLAAGRRGTSYGATILVSGGSQPYRYSYSGTLPPGLSLTVSAPGRVTLSGRPRTAGSFTFTLAVSDAARATTQRSFTVTIT